MRPFWMTALGVSIATLFPPAATLHVGLSAAGAGAANVRVQLTEHTELQCGEPRPGAISIALPTAFGLSHPLVVRVDGRRVASRIAGHRITLTVPPPSGVICDVIGPGSFTVALSSVRNPARAGTYRFSLTYDKRTLTATARVR